MNHIDRTPEEFAALMADIKARYQGVLDKLAAYDRGEYPVHAAWCNKVQEGGNSYAFECDCGGVDDDG